MVRIEMIESQQGSPDGVTVLEFDAGQAYDVPAELADVFIAEGWAKKSAGAAPENKAQGAAPQTKAKTSRAAKPKAAKPPPKKRPSRLRRKRS